MRAKSIAAVGLAGLTMLAAAGCGSGRTGGDSGGAGLVVGTTDKIFALDPAAAYDNGSLLVETQVYQFLMNFAPGEAVPKPDAAQKCGFSSPTVYSCTLKPNLKFANGNPLTANSVKFSFDRMLKINDPNGPASLLGNLDHTDAVDATTVNFTLKVANDQTFPAILPTQAGPIVDEKVFPADKLLDDDAIWKAKPFSGPYSITSYDKNKLVSYQANSTTTASSASRRPKPSPPSTTPVRRICASMCRTAISTWPGAPSRRPISTPCAATTR